MKVPFLDLKKQFEPLLPEIEREIRKIFLECSFVGGNYVQQFEGELQDYLGVKHAITCGNGTDALTLALRACGVGYGDEVITTPFTFFATAEAIASVGATPVFVDIKENDYTLDPEKVESAITEKTKCILPVQIFGNCCDMDSIMDIAKQNGLKVIEDDAQSIGSEYKGNKAGSIADIGCFSFYPTKNLGGCGDGGACTTNDDDLAVVLQSLREHCAGKSGAAAAKILGKDAQQEQLNEESNKFYDPYKYYNYFIGYNSRLDSIQAMVLSIKLKHLDSYNRRRSEIAKTYIHSLRDILFVPTYEGYSKPCWHQFCVLTEHKYELCEYLAKSGVGSGTFYPVPLHKQMAFHKGNSRISGNNLPVSERVSQQSLCLPIFPEMTDKQVEYVIDNIRQFYSNKQ